MINVQDEHYDRLQNCKKADKRAGITAEEKIIKRRQEIYDNLKKQQGLHILELHSNYFKHAGNHAYSLRYVKCCSRIHFVLHIKNFNVDYITIFAKKQDGFETFFKPSCFLFYHSMR